ncbi:MAG: nucleotide-diphospho-sugar transferase [Candidatus Pacebacteria bacterium]|jgi:hypothetical protein|nr:nucleotide-diphospho-sugar transferase [Candidatus Paceibacterota bacterium]
MKKRFNTPILLLMFNRPETTKVIWREIKKIQPSKLFIASDGPREGNSQDRKQCDQVKKIVCNIDWKCDVKRLYRKKNLGCKIAVSNAINWFFKHVGEGIILEDDCLPNSSFFIFAEKMLKKYKYNSKIFHISGNNSHSVKVDDDYYFSKYPHIWGWATWKRAWEDYDVNINNWATDNTRGIFDKVFSNKIEKTFWTEVFDKVYQGKTDTWDYQWLYCCWLHKALSITPKHNLVKNIGFTKSATHTVLKNRKIYTQTYHLNFPLKHPNLIQINKNEDKITEKKVFINSRSRIIIVIKYILKKLN